jgi:hypothetical protein
LENMKTKKARVGELTTFTGVALVHQTKSRGLETLIVPDLAAAKLLGLSAGEMRVVRAAFAQVAGQPAGSCMRQKQGGSIRCLPGTCAGNCHLFRAKLPLDPEKPKIEDLGEPGREWTEMEKGYGYWCDCV